MTGTKGSTTRPNMALPSRKEQPLLPPPRSDSRARLIIGLVLLALRGSLTSAEQEASKEEAAEERPFTIRIDENRIHALKRMLYLLSKQSSA